MPPPHRTLPAGHPTGMRGRRARLACDRCKANKRKCDTEKPQCTLCARQGHACNYSERKPTKRKYWDEDYVHGLEARVESLLAALENRPAQQPAVSSSTSQASPGPPSSSVIPAPLSQPPPPPPPLHDTLVAHASFDTAPFNDSVGATSSASEDTRLGTTSSASKTAARTNDVVSRQAMEELCVMLWRTNVGDGVTIVNDSETGKSFTVENDENDESKRNSGHKMVTPPTNVIEHCKDIAMIQQLASLFFDNINDERQFVSYTTLDFLSSYPHQAIEDAFLHSALLATGSSFSPDRTAHKVGEDLAEFAESLIFACCRKNPCLKVIQGLCMLSWRSLALGRDHIGWIFISMAAGLCVHLRLHVLALGECDARRFQASEAEIRAFWMFYIIDKTAISILGRNCTLPWRRINVPSFSSTLRSPKASLWELSFAAQCELWYIQDGYMDQVFSSSFDELDVPRQVHILVSNQQALDHFFLNLSPVLRPSTNSRDTPTPLLFLHLAYHMATLVTMPSFLRVFATSTKGNATGVTATSSPSTNTAQMSTEQHISVVLHSLTSAATNATRLVKIYLKRHKSVAAPNPVVIHHLLSAAIVHLMNTTSATQQLRRHSTYWLRQCLDLLNLIRSYWPVRAGKSIKVIRVLAQRWKATASLPMHMSSYIAPGSDPTQHHHHQPQEHQKQEQHQTHLMQPHPDDILNMPDLTADQLGTFAAINNEIPPSIPLWDHITDIQDLEMSSIPEFPSLGVPLQLERDYDDGGWATMLDGLLASDDYTHLDMPYQEHMAGSSSTHGLFFG